MEPITSLSSCCSWCFTIEGSMEKIRGGCGGGRCRGIWPARVVVVTCVIERLELFPQWKTEAFSFNFLPFLFSFADLFLSY